MRLEDELERVAILRQTGVPRTGAPATLVLLAQSLPALPAWLAQHPDLRLENIFIADLPLDTEVSFRLPPRHGSPRVHCGVAGLASSRAGDAVFFSMPEYILRQILLAMPELAAAPLWLAGELDQALARRRPLPDFYASNRQALEDAFACFEGARARRVFAARIRALASGDPGYLPFSGFMEYEHPVIGPRPGDVMLDGGVSDMVGAQRRFSRLVGETGVIHGFEPIAWMAEKAAAQLADCGNYRLHCAGLAEREGTARFASLRDSSHIGAEGDAPAETCLLLALDDFAQSQGLPGVDCLKLDVEGSELAALRGARGVIARDRPRLIVCMYHKPADLFEIPLFIRELAPDYRLDLAHSSLGFTDTILYGQAPKGAGGVVSGPGSGVGE